MYNVFPMSNHPDSLATIGLFQVEVGERVGTFLLHLWRRDSQQPVFLLRSCSWSIDIICVWRSIVHSILRLISIAVAWFMSLISSLMVSSLEGNDKIRNGWTANLSYLLQFGTGWRQELWLLCMFFIDTNNFLDVRTHPAGRALYDLEAIYRGTSLCGT